MSRPVLWHIPMSHYSEKVRWVFDHRRIEHRRRAVLNGNHVPVALVKTRGAQATFPILELDGEVVGGSGAIVAALEARYPERPLYPEDPAERAQALELERFFDAEMAPAVRLAVWSGLPADRELNRVFAPRLSPVVGWAPGLAASSAALFGRLRYGVGPSADLEAAHATIRAALDRIEALAEPGGYLVGYRLTIADIAGAALMYPLVLPPEAPRILPRVPKDAQVFKDSIKDRAGYRWVQETFRRHRAPAG